MSPQPMSFINLIRFFPIKRHNPFPGVYLKPFVFRLIAINAPPINSPNVAGSGTGDGKAIIAPPAKPAETTPSAIPGAILLVNNSVQEYSFALIPSD
jgi:hypothetical protein